MSLGHSWNTPFVSLEQSWYTSLCLWDTLGALPRVSGTLLEHSRVSLGHSWNTPLCLWDTLGTLPHVSETLLVHSLVSLGHSWCTSLCLWDTLGALPCVSGTLLVNSPVSGTLMEFSPVSLGHSRYISLCLWDTLGTLPCVSGTLLVHFPVFVGHLEHSLCVSGTLLEHSPVSRRHCRVSLEQVQLELYPVFPEHFPSVSVFRHSLFPGRNVTSFVSEVFVLPYSCTIELYLLLYLFRKITEEGYKTCYTHFYTLLRAEVR